MIRTVACSLLSLSLLCLSEGQADDSRNPSARWQPAIQEFVNADQADPRPRGGILFVGSSSIRFWDLKKHFPDQPVINHGFGGSQIADSIHFADRIVWPFRPRVIVMYAGDNDIAAGKSAETVADDFQTFSDLAHQHLPETHLIYVAIKPSVARWKLSHIMAQANQSIAERCAQHDRRTFLDIWTPMLGDDGRPMPRLFIKDGLHLNDNGYQLWSGLLSQELKRLTNQPSASTE